MPVGKKRRPIVSRMFCQSIGDVRLSLEVLVIVPRIENSMVNGLQLYVNRITFRFLLVRSQS